MSGRDRKAAEGSSSSERRDGAGDRRLQGGSFVGAARRLRGHVAGVLLGSIGLCGCGTVDAIMTGEEDPVAAEESYLATGGPQSRLDLGPDQKLLLEDFVALRKRKLELEKRIKELETANEGLRVSLERAERERDEASRQRAGEMAELERTRQILHDREARILTLALERTKLEQEVLKLRIAMMERLLEDLDRVQASAAAAPAGGGR